MVQSPIEPVGPEKVVLKSGGEELRLIFPRHICVHLTFYVLVVGTSRCHRHLKDHACITYPAQIELLKGLD